MNKLEVVHEQKVLGNDFKVYGSMDNPLFLAKDVANWIEHSDTSKMIKNIDDEEKLIRTMFLSGQNREVAMLTEDGLYEVLMQSRKPIAKQFKKQVKQILKDIRKTGGYVANDDQFINTYLQFADESTKMMFRGTLETVRKQNELIAEQKKVISIKDDIIEDQKGEIKEKEIVIDSVISDNGLYDIGVVGKILKPHCNEFGARKIFDFLKTNKILMSGSTQKNNLPYDRYNQYFEIKAVGVDRGFYVETHMKPYFTGKGLKWFLNRLVQKEYLTKQDRDMVAENIAS